MSYELNNTTILHVLHISEKTLCSVIVSIKKLKQYKFYESFLERKHRQAFIHMYIIISVFALLRILILTKSDDAVVL